MTTKIGVTGKFPVNSKKFAAYAINAGNCQSGNPNLPNPPVPGATILTLTATYVAADENVDKRVPGAVKVRKAARVKVEAALRLNEAYTRTVVQAAAPEEGAAIVSGSGFPQEAFNPHTKEAYSVGPGPEAGDARTDIKALGRHGTLQYCNQYSLDGGKTWVDMPPTLETAMIFSGLPIGTQASFRFRTLIKGEYGTWSQTLVYTVH